MIKLGLIGCGAVGVGAYLPAVAELAGLFEIVGVADARGERARKIGANLGLGADECYAETTELLDRGDVDAVVIATPPNQHGKLAQLAAERGKHVLCEKPLSTRPAEAWAAVDAAKGSGVQLAMMHNYLFLPEYLAVKKELGYGAIGDVSVVVVDALGVKDNRGADGRVEYNWRHDLDVAGGGVLMDMIHLLYIAEFLLGAEISKVSGYVDTTVPGDVVESLALCRLQALNAVALVNVAWGEGPGGTRVMGSDGRLSVRYRMGGTSPFDRLESLTVVKDGEETEVATTGGESGFVRILRDFADSITEGRPPVGTGAAAARALETAVSTYASAAWQRVVDLPLARGTTLYELGARGVWDGPVSKTSSVYERSLFRGPEGK